MFKYAFSGALLALMGIMMLLGCSNLDTPAGYVGYVTQDSVFGKTQYVGLQQGPTSTGLSFLVHVVNVSITPYTRDENFTIGNGFDEAIVAKDKLKMQFSMHVLWNVKPDAVKDYVERFAVISTEATETSDTVAASTYENFVSPKLRSIAREEIEKFEGLDLKDHMADISSNCLRRIQEFVKDTPFVIAAINVGAIQPPQALSDEISKVQQMSQKIAQKDKEIEVHVAQKDGRIAEALGIQQSMKDLSGKLTPQYLAWEAIKAQKALGDSLNHSITYISSGFPVTGTLPITQLPATASTATTPEAGK